MKEYKSPMPEITIKYKSGECKKVKVKNSEDSASVFRQIFNSDTIEYSEEFCVLFLNSANTTIGWSKLSSGGMTSTVVDVRVLLTQALLCGAVALMVAHNHPSGQLVPSNDDERVTRRIAAGCEAIGVQFLEHIILSGTDDKYYSFADNGKI